MAGWINMLWKDSLVYGLGYGVSRFLQVIILPIIAQSLTVSEFGYYSNFVIFYTFLAGLFVMGLDSAVARFLYDSDSRQHHSRLLSTALGFIVLIAVTMMFLLFFFRQELTGWLDVPAQYAETVPYLLLTIPAVAANNMLLSWFKWKKQKYRFLINSGGSVVLLMIPLVISPSVNFLLVFQVLCFSQLLVALVSVFFAREYLVLQPDISLLKKLLAYGFPWMLVFVFGASRTYLDRVFLSGYLPDEAYGRYNFSVRVATLLSLVITAFEMSFGPLAFSIWDKEGAPAFFARLQGTYLVFISATACAIAIVSPLLVQLLGGGAYNGAEAILPLLLFAAIPVSLVNFSNMGTVYARKSLLGTASLFAGFAGVLLLNVVLTRHFLEYGAAASLLAGHLIIIVTGYAISRKFYYIPFSFYRDGALFVFFLLLSLVAVHVRLFNQLYLDMAVKLVMLCLIAVFLLVRLFPLEWEKGLSMLQGMVFRRKESQ